MSLHNNAQTPTYVSRRVRGSQAIIMPLTATTTNPQYALEMRAARASYSGARERRERTRLVQVVQDGSSDVLASATRPSPSLASALITKS